MKTKLSVLKEHAANGDWAKAVSIAAKFTRLGEDRNAILDADMAFKNPSFCAAIKKDPKLLKARGIAAIKQRYSI